MAKKRYQSRAARCEEKTSQLEDIKGQLEEMRNEIDEADVNDDGDYIDQFPELQEKIDAAENILADLDKELFSDLLDEMETWRDNMSGTNLEQTEKYATIDETVGYLENANSELDNIETSFERDGTRAEVCDWFDCNISALEDAISEAENAEFPSAFG